ncbi:MAG: hypothetical protein WCC10_09110 [Tumebacillaceae bacterium]
MNQEQKKLMIQEIRQWKESRILPAEYCDFLMNLYAEGDQFSSNSHSSTQEVKGDSRESRMWSGQIQRMLLIFVALLLFLIFAFNFTMFPMPMQIVVLLIATFLPYFLARRFGRQPGLGRVVWLSAAAFLLAMDGYYYLFSTDQLGDRLALVVVMSIVSVLWVLIGGMGRSRLIAGIGCGGLLIMFATLLEEVLQMNAPSYIVLHLYWIVPAAVALLVARMLGRGGVYIAPVFLWVGLLALFGPELRLLAFREPLDFFIQAIVFLKLAVLIAMLIVYRDALKRWISNCSV